MNVCLRIRRREFCTCNKSLLPAPTQVSVAPEQESAATRALGLTSYPSLLMDSGDDLRSVELTYDPDVLVDRIKAEPSKNWAILIRVAGT